MKKEVEDLIEEHRTRHLVIDGRDYGEFKLPPNVAYEDLIAKGLIDSIPGWDPHHWMIEEKEDKA